MRQDECDELVVATARPNARAFVEELRPEQVSARRPPMAPSAPVNTAPSVPSSSGDLPVAATAHAPGDMPGAATARAVGESEAVGDGAARLELQAP